MTKKLLTDWRATHRRTTREIGFRVSSNTSINSSCLSNVVKNVLIPRVDLLFRNPESVSTVSDEAERSEALWYSGEKRNSTLLHRVFILAVSCEKASLRLKRRRFSFAGAVWPVRVDLAWFSTARPDGTYLRSALTYRLESLCPGLEIWNMKNYWNGQFLSGNWRSAGFFRSHDISFCASFIIVLFRSGYFSHVAYHLHFIFGC